MGKKIGGKIKSAPTVVNGTLYVGSTNGNVFALSVSSGDQVWNYTTGDRVLASPAYGDKKIFIGSVDGTMYSLNSADGKLLGNTI